MTELSENPDRKELREFYENSDEVPTDGHENYGDVNPAPHGGMWVEYEPEWGAFEMVETLTQDREEPFDQYVFVAEAHFEDLVTESGEFTESARRTAESLHGANNTPAGLIVDGRWTWFVVAWLSERTTAINYGHGASRYEGEYSEILEKVGVEPAE